MGSEKAAEQEPGQGKLLRFSIGAYQFCVSALDVVAIITPPRLTVFPLSAVDVVGAFSYQGQIVACIDLRQKFDLRIDPDQHSGQLLLGHVDEMSVAFWVDHVADIVVSETMHWSPLPSLQTQNNVFSGCYLSDQEIILMTSIEQMYHGDRGTVNTCLQALVAEQASNQVGNQANNLPLPLSPHSASTRPPSVLDGSDPDVGAFAESVVVLGADEDMTDQYAMAMAALTDESIGGKVEGRQAMINPSPGDDALSARMLNSVSVTVAAVEERVDEAESVAEAHEKECRDVVTSNDVPMVAGDDRSWSEMRPELDSVTLDAAIDTPEQHPLIKAPVSGDATVIAADIEPNVARMDKRPDVEDAEKIVSVEPGPSGIEKIETEDEVAALVLAITAKPASRVVRVAPPDDFFAASSSDRVTEQRADVGGPLASSAQGSSRPVSRSFGVMMRWFLLALAMWVLGYGLWSTFIDEQQGAQSPLLIIGKDSVGKSSEQVLPPVSALAREEVLPVSVTPVVVSEQPPLREVLRINDSDLQIRVERDADLFLPQAERLMAASSSIDMAMSPEPVFRSNQLAAPVLSASSVVPMRVSFRHIVVSGDTLWQIARKHLGNPYRYPQLVKLSQIDDPDLIYPGDIVTIEFLNGSAP